MPVVNIAGIAPGKLKLTGPVLADIYAGKIKTLERPGDRRRSTRASRCPTADIAVVHRSDGSGTTLQLHPLSEPGQPGVEGEPRRGQPRSSWPTGVGGKGNEGVAGYVKQIPNSIGYVEYAYVVQNHMTYAPLQNAAGQVRRAERGRASRPPPRAPTGRTRRISSWS